MMHGKPCERFFTSVERIMTEYQGRPHWGKLHARDADDLAHVPPDFASFTALHDRVDPEHRFGNSHLARILGDWPQRPATPPKTF